MIEKQYNIFNLRFLDIFKIIKLLKKYCQTFFFKNIMKLIGIEKKNTKLF